MKKDLILQIFAQKMQGGTAPEGLSLQQITEVKRNEHLFYINYEHYEIKNYLESALSGGTTSLRRNITVGG